MSGIECRYGALLSSNDQKSDTFESEVSSVLNTLGATQMEVVPGFGDFVCPQLILKSGKDWSIRGSRSVSRMVR